VSHACPARGCSETVADDKLLCWTDWRRVPPALQQAVYAAWNGGRGAGTPEHRAACAAATDAASHRREQRGLTGG
jgi:alkylhydroperoxidase family enzyme